MALKTNFEDSNVISSPFVDEVANPGNRSLTQAERRAVGRGDAALNEQGRAALKAESFSSKVKSLAKDINDRRKAGKAIGRANQKDAAKDRARKRRQGF